MSPNFLNTLRTKEEIEFEVEEIKIKLPNGGHISAKWWGDKSIRPFICLHGWYDNAGTFDRLIPLLPREFSYLAIDLPGHGKSSWLPKGVSYHKTDFLYALNFLMNDYKWKSISIIAHSFGGHVAFIYAGIFPERVDMVITIEAIKPPNQDFNSTIAEMKDSLENFLTVDQRIFDNSEPPAYTIDEMVERIFEGSGQSVTRECAAYLLKRSIQPSRKHPGKFYFAKDARLKFLNGLNLPLEAIIDIAKDIKSPYLAIRAASTFHNTSFENKANYEAVINAMKESKNFEFLEVDSSSHHLHLTEPEKIADAISKFIFKHKTLKSHL